VLIFPQYAAGAREAHVAEQYYKRFFFPLLRPHQSVWVVPGVYGPGGDATQMAATDNQLAAKLSAYWEFAKREPRVTGMIGWHWSTLYPTFVKTMRVGGTEYPRTKRMVAAIVDSLKTDDDVRSGETISPPIHQSSRVPTDSAITGRYIGGVWLFRLPNGTLLDVTASSCSVQTVFDIAVSHGYNVHISGGAMSGIDAPGWISCTTPIVLRPSLYLRIDIENVMIRIVAANKDGLTFDSSAGLQFRWLGQLVYNGNGSAVPVRTLTSLPASGGAPGPHQFLNNNVYIGTIAQDAGGNKASSMVRLSGDVGSISTNIFTFAELNGGGSDLQPVQCSDGIVLEGTIMYCRPTLQRQHNQSASGGECDNHLFMARLFD
jgi:hypothetical protein